MLDFLRATQWQIASPFPSKRPEELETSQHVITTHRRRRILLVVIQLVLITLSLLIATAWYLSKQRSGFSITVISQNVLTYAPTALLLIVVAGWRQIDYACKTSAPWLAISKIPTSAKKSVLLDYVSSLQLFSFYQSLRNRHFTVSLGIFGFVLLKLATIASTALLVLETHVRFEQQSTHALDTFDGTLYNASNFSPLQDQSSGYATFGILAQQLDPPFGTSNIAAYSTFDRPRSSNANTTFSVVVDAIYPTFECKPVNVTIKMAPLNNTDINPEHEIQLPYTNCDSIAGKIYALNPGQYRCPNRQLSGVLNTFHCNTTNTSEQWILLTMTDIRYAQSINSSKASNLGSPIEATSSSTTIANMANIACQMSYTTGKLNVSGDLNAGGNGMQYNALSQNGNGDLKGFSSENLTSIVDMARSAASSMFGNLVDNSYALEYPNTIFKLMSSTLPQNSYESLLDESQLMNAAQKVYRQLAVQVISRYLRRPGSSSLMSQVVHDAEVLSVSEISTWLMIGAFMGTCAIGLLLARLRALTVPGALSIHDTSSLVRLSNSIVPLLQDCQGRDESGVQKVLATQEFAFHDANNTGMAIRAIEQTTNLDLPVKSDVSENIIAWWKQITISYWFLALTFIYAITVVAVLELTQRLSDSHHGLGTVITTNEALQSTFTHYLPALVVILLATMFNCLDFNVLLLQPYNKLMRGVSAEKLSQRPGLYRMPIISYWNSIRGLDMAVIGSSSAAFVGALLTIVVSGLYTIENVSTPLDIGVSTTTLMQPTWTNSVVEDGGAAILLSLTENLNLSYPEGTYRELYLPSVTSGPLSQRLNRASSTTNQVVEVQMPAYRANLTCETAATGQFNVSLATTRIQKSATISGNYPLPPGCLLGGPAGNESFVEISQTFNIASNATEAYIAKLLDVHVGPFNGILGSSMGEFADNGDPLGPNPDNPPGCPSVALIYGYLGPSDISQSSTEGTLIEGKSIAFQVCYQQLNRLQVNATFEGTQMKLVQNDSTINTIEASATVLTVPNNSSDTDANATAFQFRVQRHFDNGLSFFNNTENVFSTGAFTTSTVDRFFQGVFFGRYAIPLETMQLRSDDDFNKLQDGVLALYQRYMAQAMSRKMTVSVESASAAQLSAQAKDLSFTGLLTSGDGSFERRLMQHQEPKIILQCLIGVMIVGGLVAVSTTRLMKILPAHANPCTIWGQMGIWAGSEYCSIASDLDTRHYATRESATKKCLHVKVSEVQSDQNDTRTLFRLGWWTRKSVGSNVERWYGIDIDPKTEI